MSDAEISIMPDLERIYIDKTCLEALYEKTILGKKMAEWLLNHDIEKILLYGANKYAKWILMNLDSSEEKIICNYICDKNNKLYESNFENRQVISKEQMSEMYRNDNFYIIICALSYENEIREELIRQGVLNKHILSAREIIAFY